MIAIVIGLVSAALFYLSGTVADAWPLAWIAYTPLLWLAYGPDRFRHVVLAVVVVSALFTFLLLLPIIQVLAPIIVGLLPQIVLSLIVPIAALFFARQAKKRLHLMLALLAFPAFVTGAAYVEWLVTGGDTGVGFASMAYSQVEFPLLAQSAGLFGAWSIVFLLCLFANGVALALRDKRHATAVGGVTLCVFAANLIFGLVQFQFPRAESVRIGLAAQDLPLFSPLPSGGDRVVTVTTAYSDVVRKLAAEGASAVVLPELIAVLRPGYREEALAPLASVARDAGATIIVGFAELNDNAQRNIALTFVPDGSTSSYVKRHPLTPLDMSIPGDKPGLLGNGRAVAICKDMDFPATIRSDAQSGIQLMYVPAADFNVDGWTHGRMAILRGIENGFAIARAARNGMLTLTDAQGRIVASSASGTGDITSLVGDVPLGPGNTIYHRIGDTFAWACLALASALLTWMVCARARSSAIR